MRAGLDPTASNLWTWPALLKKPDPWTGFRDAAVSLKPVLKKLGI